MISFPNGAFYRRILLGFSGLALIFGFAPATAEKPKIQPPKRPTIGLVLEGGGALGFAHIGAIEWLEAHHIPIDYLAGTSMGGLVGGLYAAGNRPEDIKNLVDNIHWPGVLSGQVPFQSLSYRRKEDKLAYPNRLDLGLKNGISLPKGLNSGAAVGLLLDRTLIPYYDLQSFDDLPIPFRCVATELTTGSKHVFKDGSLAQAMRATMSIPGMFAPVQHGNELYSDGSAVDNLPVDVGRAMGADVVIAVYLDTGPVKPKDISSPLAVAGRTFSIMVAANEMASKKNANILINADVSKFSTTDFDKSTQIIPQGEKAAEAKASELEKYALNDADWKAYLAERNARKRTHVPIPQFVDVYGLKGADRAEVAESFTKYVGKPVDTVALEKTIAELEGTGSYSIINYNMVDEQGRPGLLIRPRTKDYAPPFLNVGLTILANDSNNVQLGAGARATFTNLVGPRSELRLEGTVGQIAGLNAELYKPLSHATNWFAAPHAYIEHKVTGLYSNGSQLAQFKENRNGVGIDIGYEFNARTELRAGEDYQWFSVRRTVGAIDGHDFSLTPFVTSLRFQYLGQDEVMLPTKGSEARAAFHHYTARPNANGGLSQFEGTLAHFIPVGARGIAFGTASGGTSFGASNLGLAGFSLGGPLRLTAYSRGELLGTDYFLGQAGYLYRLTHLNPIFGDAIYAGGFYELGKLNGTTLGTPSTPNDGTALIVIKTMIGPLYGGGSIGGSDHAKWYFGLGRIF